MHAPSGIPGRFGEVHHLVYTAWPAQGDADTTSGTVCDEGQFHGLHLVLCLPHTNYHLLDQPVDCMNLSIRHSIGIA